MFARKSLPSGSTKSLLSLLASEQTLLIDFQGSGAFFPHNFAYIHEERPTHWQTSAGCPILSSVLCKTWRFLWSQSPLLRNCLQMKPARRTARSKLPSQEKSWIRWMKGWFGRLSTRGKFFNLTAVDTSAIPYFLKVFMNPTTDKHLW